MVGPLRSRRYAAVGALVAFGFGLAGCGGSSSAASGAKSKVASPSGPAATSHVVTAEESEFKIVLSRTSFTPGTYTFRVNNTGSDTHGLSINGPGVNNATTGSINPGSSKSMKVTLRQGSYDVYCPVANHKELGMNLTITVT